MNPILGHLKAFGARHETASTVNQATGLIAYRKLNKEPMHKLLIIDLEDKSIEQESALDNMMDLLVKGYDKRKQKKPYICLVSKPSHDETDQRLVDLAARVGIDRVLFKPVELININKLMR